MQVALGSDHAGYELKKEIMKHLHASAIECRDFGPFSDSSVDYPDFAALVSEAVQSGLFSFGILICGTGIGMSVAANKHPHIRAALCSETYSARLARKHNDANILTMGSRVIGPGLAIAIVDTFLHTSFEGGRHMKRLEKIACMDKNRPAS